jgi:hypothetical protein
MDEWKQIRCEEWRNQQVSKLARDLWEKKGCPSGQDLQIWLEAELIFFASDEANANHGPGGDW